jgi:serine/threonine protein kinase/WD40 repeat protein
MLEENDTVNVFVSETLPDVHTRKNSRVGAIFNVGGATSAVNSTADINDWSKPSVTPQLLLPNTRAGTSTTKFERFPVIDPTISSPRAFEKSVRWKRGEILGQGAFGVVYLGLNIDTGELMAVKQIAVEEVSNRELSSLQNEINLLRTLRHPNIVRYIGTEVTPSALSILLEYVPGGSLKALIDKFGKLEENVARSYTRQLLLGLEYLHRNGIAHRDVKGANCLVGNDGAIKMADFGASMYWRANSITAVGAAAVSGSTQRSSDVRGTPSWMAPEVVQDQDKYLSWKKADVWSLGCTTIEMTTGKPPWCQFSNPVTVVYHIACSDSVPQYPENASMELTTFLNICLQRDPTRRPDITSLLLHPFVASMGNGSFSSSMGGTWSNTIQRPSTVSTIPQEWDGNFNNSMRDVSANWKNADRKDSNNISMRNSSGPADVGASLTSPRFEGMSPRYPSSQMKYVPPELTSPRRLSRSAKADIESSDELTSSRAAVRATMRKSSYADVNNEYLDDNFRPNTIMRNDNNDDNINDDSKSVMKSSEETDLHNARLESDPDMEGDTNLLDSSVESLHLDSNLMKSCMPPEIVGFENGFYNSNSTQNNSKLNDNKTEYLSERISMESLENSDSQDEINSIDRQMLMKSPDSQRQAIEKKDKAGSNTNLSATNAQKKSSNNSNKLGAITKSSSQKPSDNSRRNNGNISSNTKRGFGTPTQSPKVTVKKSLSTVSAKSTPKVQQQMSSAEYVSHDSILSQSHRALDESDENASVDSLSGDRKMVNMWDVEEPQRSTSQMVLSGSTREEIDDEILDEIGYNNDDDNASSDIAAELSDESDAVRLSAEIKFDYIDDDSVDMGVSYSGFNHDGGSNSNGNMWHVSDKDYPLMSNRITTANIPSNDISQAKIGSNSNGSFDNYALIGHSISGMSTPAAPSMRQSNSRLPHPSTAGSKSSKSNKNHQTSGIKQLYSRGSQNAPHTAFGQTHANLEISGDSIDFGKANGGFNIEEMMAYNNRNDEDLNVGKVEYANSTLQLNPVGSIFEEHSAAIVKLRVVSSKNVFLSASMDGTVRMWSSINEADVSSMAVYDTSTSQQSPTKLSTGNATLTSITKSVSRITSMWTDSMCETVWAGCSDGSIRVWNGDDTKFIRLLRGHEDVVTVMEGTSSSNLNGAVSALHIVATGSADKSVRVWDMRSKKGQSVLFKGHTDSITSLKWIDGGRIIVSASKDKTVKMWDTRAGRYCNIIFFSHFPPLVS